MPIQVKQITNYDELRAAIAIWLDRDDLTINIEAFIQLMEKSPETRSLRHFKKVKREFGAGSQDDPNIALPDEWEESRNVEIDGIQVTYKSPDELDILRDAVNYPGNTAPVDLTPFRPKYFTYHDSHLVFWPVPSDDFTVTLEYYERIPPLADALLGENWLLTLAPGAYLYGSLVHSAPFLRDDPRIALWKRLFDTEIGALGQTSTDAMTSGSRLNKQAPVKLG